MVYLNKCLYLFCKVAVLGVIGILTSIMIYVSASGAGEYKILVLGTVEETISFYKEADFWGEVDRSKPLDVPRGIAAVINQSWREEAKQVTVAIKKELFFRVQLVKLISYLGSKSFLFVFVCAFSLFLDVPRPLRLMSTSSTPSRSWVISSF